MRKSWTRAAVICVAAASLGAWLLLRLHPREPQSGGKGLREWIAQLDGDRAEAAQTALQSMGIAIIPYLFDQIKQEHPARQRTYALVWPWLPLVVQQRLDPPKTFLRYGNPNSTVVRCLRLLDASAVPVLVAALRDSDSEIQITAMAGLAGFGERASCALGPLIQLRKDRNGFVRRWAVFTLGRIGPERVKAIPELIDALADADISPLPGSPARVRETAADVLGEMGAEALAAVPALQKLLKDRDDGVRQAAAIALWRIRRSTDILPVLIAELEKTREYDVRKRLISLLGEIGPQARPAVPAIRNVLEPSPLRGGSYMRVTVAFRPGTNQSSGTTLADIAAEALRKIAPDSPSGAPGRLFEEAQGLKW